jgi:hypothetical protein
MQQYLNGDRATATPKKCTLFEKRKDAESSAFGNKRNARFIRHGNSLTIFLNSRWKSLMLCKKSRSAIVLLDH